MEVSSQDRAPSYAVVPDWEKLPSPFRHWDVAGVSVDSRDRIYLITRFDPHLLVFERDGSFVAALAEGLWVSPHGVTVGPDDSIYCVDDGSHCVRKLSPAGDLLLTLGTPGRPSCSGYDGQSVGSVTHGGGPFNRPTNLAVAPNGDLYVSDGYGNCQVHQFSPDGQHTRSWGEPGSGPGQFMLPHGIRVLPDGRVLVADRENDRIQFFSLTGQYLCEWSHIQRPADIFLGHDGLLYISELEWRPGMISGRQGVIKERQHGRIAVLDPAGNVLARWGGPEPSEAGSFLAPHCLCVDSQGSVYVGEVGYTHSQVNGLGDTPYHELQKLARQV